MSFCSNTLVIGIWITCALAMAAPQGRAEAAVVSRPLTVPGGVIDPTITDADVYVDAPIPAKPPPICRAAAKYVGLLDSGRFNHVADLYADDAIVFQPVFERRAVGRQEIDKFYQTYVGKAKPNVVAVSFVGGLHDCIMVMATRRLVNGKPRYLLSTIDHFTVNAAGKFSSMVAYARPGGNNYPMASGAN